MKWWQIGGLRQCGDMKVPWWQWEFGYWFHQGKILPMISTILCCECNYKDFQTPEIVKGSVRNKRVRSMRKGWCCIMFFINYKLVFNSCCPADKGQLDSQLLVMAVTVGQLPKCINLKKWIDKMWKRITDQTMEVQKRLGFSGIQRILRTNEVGFIRRIWCRFEKVADVFIEGGHFLALQL